MTTIQQPDSFYEYLSIIYLIFDSATIYFLLGISRHLEKICYGCRSSHEVRSRFSTKQYSFWNTIKYYKILLKFGLDKVFLSASKLRFSACNWPRVIISWEMKVLLLVGLLHCWKTFWKRYLNSHCFVSFTKFNFFKMENYFDIGDVQVCRQRCSALHLHLLVQVFKPNWWSLERGD